MLRYVTLCSIACLLAGAAIAQPRPSVARTTSVTWLLFIDDLHRDFRNTGRIRNALKVMTAALILDGDTFRRDPLVQRECADYRVAVELMRFSS